MLKLFNLVKRIVLIGTFCGIAGAAHANQIVLTSASTLNGEYAYEYLVNMTAGLQITSASLIFSDIKLTHSGSGNDISFDIMNRSDSSRAIYDHDYAGDYFTSHSPYSSTAVNLGQKNFSYVNQTLSWTYDFTGTTTTGTLGILNNYAANGLFDFGFDPDCIYKVGSIVFKYTYASSDHPPSVPDTTMTAGLLGVGFAALVFTQRKLRVRSQPANS